MRPSSMEAAAVAAGNNGSVGAGDVALDIDMTRVGGGRASITQSSANLEQKGEYPIAQVVRNLSYWYV